MHSASLYEPVRKRLHNVNAELTEIADKKYPFLAQMLDYTLSTPGKYIRPTITLLASSFYPHDERTTEKMAMSVELLHIASLIHDDTVDGAALRRGKQTVGSLWGHKAAVLAGDYIFAAAATFVCDTGNIRVIRRFAETVMDLSSGELQEMADTFSPEQSLGGYLDRIHNKTASLFITAAESGAVLSGAPETSSDAMRRYGRNIGMAFQVVDDILDFDGTEEETGKPIGSDLANGIITLPTLIAMKRKSCCDVIRRALAHPDNDDLMKEVVGIVQDDAVLEESYEFANRYCEKALASLNELPAGPPRDSLEELVSHVKMRRN